jgi:hypothetical protein
MKIDLKGRSPAVMTLPDGRHRVTRVYDVLNSTAKTPAELAAEMQLAWGTADAEYTDCRLVLQNVTGQDGPLAAPLAEAPKLTRIFETISATAETEVGNPGVAYDQAGNLTLTKTFLQFSTATASYGTVGTSSATSPNGVACILKSEVRTDDGTLRQIRREYIDHGILSDVETLKFNGKLLLRELTYLNEIPPTPSGWVLLTTSVQYPEGLPVYRYGFANGSAGGNLGLSTDYRQSSDQGTTGVTVTTIRQITAPSVSTNPISTPAGMVLISVSYMDEDGYRMWTAVYAKGTGLVSVQTSNELDGAVTYTTNRSLGVAVPATGEFDSSSENADGYTIYTSRGIVVNTADLPDEVRTQNNGALVLTTKRKIDSAPTGTGGVVSESQDPRSGYTLYTKTWAVGEGEISRSNQDHLNGLVTYTTVRSLGTAVAATGEFETSFEEGDGYDINVSRGIVVNSADLPNVVETRNNGALVITTMRKINSAPSMTGALIEEGSTQQEGYTLYTRRYAVGVGEIGRAIDYSRSVNQGTTGVTRTQIRYIVAPSGTVQPTSLAGSILVGADFTEGDGYRVWTTTWACGTGLVTQLIHARQDGLREVTNIALGTRVAPDGLVIRDDYELDSGFTVYTVSTIQSRDGGSATGATLAFERYVPFKYPGRAKAYTFTSQNDWSIYDVFQSPPVQTDVLATVTVTYQSSASLGSVGTYWNPSEWATIQAEWVGPDNMPGFVIRALSGYRSTSATPLTFEAPGVGGFAGTMIGNPVYGGTTAKLTVSGGPADPGGSTFTLDAVIEPAFTTTAGTVYYRKTVTSAAIPSQAELPV